MEKREASKINSLQPSPKVLVSCRGLDGEENALYQKNRQKEREEFLKGMLDFMKSRLDTSLNMLHLHLPQNTIFSIVTDIFEYCMNI